MNPTALMQRRQVVERAREGWVRRLIDLSRRNNLLYYRDLRAGTLDLTGADRAALTDLWHGKTVPLTRLLPGADDLRLAAVIREIARRAQANLEEKGLETLFLTVGMATWAPSDDGRPPEAAVLLMPVSIEMRGLGRNAALRRNGEIQANLVLLHVLEVEHGCKVNPEWLMDVDLDGEDDDHFDPHPVFDRLTGEARSIKGFKINWRLVLSNFSFQKLAMVRDLRERAEELVGHDLIAAIAGDGGAREAVKARGAEIAAEELDAADPLEEHLVLDADSSQHRVAATVLTGQSTVIQGPPGTGKSQTIANLIASLAASGKRVLFVAEKRAALEVVQNRLEGAELGHLALDLHGADLTRSEIMRRVAASLNLVRNAPPSEGEDAIRRFSDCRVRLNEHVRRLHRRREPSGLSTYQIQGKLLRLPPDAQSPLRWRQGELERLTGAAAQQIEDLLREAGGFPGLLLRDDPSPWTGAALPNGQAVQQAIDLVWQINSRWLSLKAETEAICSQAGMEQPNSLEGAQAAVGLAAALTKTLEDYSPELFEQDLAALYGALAPAGKGGLSAIFASLFSGAYKQALATLRSLRRQGQLIKPAQLYRELTVALDHQRRWQQFAQPGMKPVATPGAAAVQEALKALTADLEAVAPLLARPDLLQLDLKRFTELFTALTEDTDTPHYVASVLGYERQIIELGAEKILTEIRRLKPRPKAWPLLFRHAWLSSCLDQARLEEPALAGFKGRTHDQYVTEFRRLDRQRLKLAASRVRRRHAEHAIAVMNAYPDQEALVRREAEKKSRHLPLRKLLAQAPDVLTALFPCWMASPLSVSQLIDADRKYFDVVMFDEASQVLPEDAVPALLRGEQAVVAGDEHQLPPTIFFADGAGEEAEAEGEEELSATAGFESLLKLTSAFLPQRMLQWHYRSRDEALIAFSNRHIYQEQLVTFPGRGGEATVSHILVEQESGTEGPEDSATAEVRKVVDLILEHAETRPHESLGVIAMGIKHAQRLQAELDRRLAEQLSARPELTDFFDTTREERFFIKNLERVQGDERDVILLTIGYGKDKSGRLPYRFGPLLQEGGERRLNVAVTRAKRRMILVSSFSHLDMDPDRSKSKGVELLRAYLEYAASQGRRIGPHGEGEATPSEFEQDVYEALTAEGLPLKQRWGVSGYRIDLAAQHPERTGQFVLAIECDGGSYQSAPTARDRDRLRQQHLENLGWRFHRIWSTDWFLRRDEEIGRAVAAYRDAVALADAAEQPVQEAAPMREARVAAVPEPAREPAAPVQGRAPRPAIPEREKVDDYSQRELDALVHWIKSDGQLRTDDQILDEMVRELGFRRRGVRIENAVREAIARTR